MDLTKKTDDPRLGLSVDDLLMAVFTLEQGKAKEVLTAIQTGCRQLDAQNREYGKPTQLEREFRAQKTIFLKKKEKAMKMADCLAKANVLTLEGSEAVFDLYDRASGELEEMGRFIIPEGDFEEFMIKAMKNGLHGFIINSKEDQKDFTEYLRPRREENVLFDLGKSEKGRKCKNAFFFKRLIEDGCLIYLTSMGAERDPRNLRYDLLMINGGMSTKDIMPIPVFVKLVGMEDKSRQEIIDFLRSAGAEVLQRFTSTNCRYFGDNRSWPEWNTACRGCKKYKLTERTSIVGWVKHDPTKGGDIYNEVAEGYGEVFFLEVDCYDECHFSVMWPGSCQYRASHK